MVDLQVAKDAWIEATRLRASSKVILALFETGFVESDFKIYANPNVPESMKIPHDAVGYDHKSVGFLQQQVPWWGTAAQCMNTAYATRQFVNRAKTKESRYSTAGKLAQAVQVSAFPTRYDQMQSRAITLINQVKGSVPKPVPTPGKPPVWPGHTFRYPPGISGADVKQWQTQLHSRGWNITPDGSYGPNSKKIATQFQQKNKLAVDGAVGKNTWNAAWTVIRSLGEPLSVESVVADASTLDVPIQDAELALMTPLAELITPDDVYAQKEEAFESEPDIPGI